MGGSANLGRAAMKVLILSQYFYPEVGATQTRMHEFARHLAAGGHEVVVIAEFPNHPHGQIPASYRGKLFEEENRDGFRILRVWVWASKTKNFRTRMLFYNSYLLMSVMRAVPLRKPDVVIATSPPLFVGVAGWIVARLKGSVFVLDVRDLWPAAAVAMGELSSSRLIRCAENVEHLLYRKANHIVAVTQGFCRHIQDCGIAPGKITWIPNGTIASFFCPGPPAPQLKREAGMDDRFVVMFAGTEGIAQGLMAVLDAAEACRNDRSIGFVLIGDGPMHERLVEQKERRNLDNVYLKKQLPLDEIVPFLNASDALLVPLRKDPVFETFVPSKLFDYMACGKPVLLGVNGEAERILREAGAGVHYTPERPEALLAAIRYLRDNPTARREMGQRGRSYVEAHFDRASQARHLEKLLLDLQRVQGPR